MHGVLTRLKIDDILSLVVITQRLREVVMFKISGAYADDFLGIVDQLNESAKKLENYSIDGDTYGTLIESLDGVKTIIADIEGCLLELNHNVSERMITINASLL